MILFIHEKIQTCMTETAVWDVHLRLDDCKILDWGEAQHGIIFSNIWIHTIMLAINNFYYLFFF